MNLGALEQSLSRLNQNKDALMGSVTAMGGATPDILPGLLQKMNQYKQQSSILPQSRRQKNSQPVMQLADGSILYSDGSVEKQDEIADQASVEALPNYIPDSEAIQEPYNVSEGTDATAEATGNAFASTERDTESEQLAEEPMSAFDSFMQAATRMPLDLKAEIEQFMQQGQDQQGQEGQPQEEEYFIQNENAVPQQGQVIQTDPRRSRNSWMTNRISSSNMPQRRGYSQFFAEDEEEEGGGRYGF